MKFRCLSMERITGLVKKLEIWGSPEIQLTKQIGNCLLMLKNKKIINILKWIQYIKFNTKRSWYKHDKLAPTPSNLKFLQKMMCCPFGEILREQFILIGFLKPNNTFLCGLSQLTSPDGTLKKRNLNWLIAKAWISFMTGLGLTLFCRLGTKILELA